MLLWPTQTVPDEIRRLLLGLIALFGVLSIVLSMVSVQPADAALIAAGTSALNIAIAAWLAWFWDRPPSNTTLVILLLVAALSLLTGTVVAEQPMTIMATGLPFAFAIAWMRPWLPLVLAVVAIWGGGALIQLSGGAGYPLQEMIIMTALFGAPVIALIAVNIGWQLQMRLDRHQADQNELAVTRERLRFATDLHDIQGHALLTIQLKAELARRTIDDSPDRAREELSSIEQLAGETDRQTHDLAQGYRTLNLSAELANVEQLLTAAGITVELQRTATPPKELDELFGVLVREAISNILRHSSATTVHIRISDTTLTIINNGAIPASEDREPTGGTGLTGLQRRFTDHCGSVTWRRDGDLFTIIGAVADQP